MQFYAFLRSFTQFSLNKKLNLKLKKLQIEMAESVGQDKMQPRGQSCKTFYGRNLRSFVMRKSVWPWQAF